MIDNADHVGEKLERLKQIVSELESQRTSNQETAVLLDEASSRIEELLNQLQDV